MPEKEKHFTISELSHEFNITSRSIRHYEDQNLISPERRGTHRIYSLRDKVRLQLILRGKRLGFSLAEIREIIDLYDLPEGKQKQAKLLAGLIQERRDALLQQRKDINFMLKELDMLKSKLD